MDEKSIFKRLYETPVGNIKKKKDEEEPGF
jgi:hypothetical protein